MHSFSTARTKQVKDPLAYENIPARLKAEIFDVNKSWCVRTRACAYLLQYVRVAVKSVFGGIVYTSLSAQEVYARSRDRKVMRDKKKVVESENQVPCVHASIITNKQARSHAHAHAV